MSRGERHFVDGNLSNSMRENYQQGIAEYYTKVKSTYRNPHFPGIRLCLFSWLNRWLQEEQHIIKNDPDVLLFDMACGSGEATMVFVEWYDIGKKLDEDTLPKKSGISSRPQKSSVQPVPLNANFPKPHVMAADPFTSDAYKDRTSYPCSDLSFAAIAEGSLPSFSVNITDSFIRKFPIPTADNIPEHPEVNEPRCSIEMVVCSFALHLVETSSNLFALLWQLSLKARWLVILAPHKKPEIKEGWGWCKWDAHKWSDCKMSDIAGEFLYERVHCRIYRSVNYHLATGMSVSN